MKSVKDILNSISANNSLGLKLLFIIASVYCLSTALYFSNLKVTFIGVLLCSIVVSKHVIKSKVIWALFLIIFSIDVIHNFYDEANHHFLLTYITLIVVLHLNGVFNYKILIKNIKYLTVIVLAFATLQKLFSEQFISGEFYYYMFNSGRFFKPIVTQNMEQLALIKSNNAAIRELALINPNNSNASAQFQNIFPHLGVICVVFAWLTIAVECIATLLLLLKPTHKLTHIVLLILILGIFSTRLETGFLAILCIAGFLITTNKTFKTIYLFLLLLFLSLIITKLGFY
ncbi:MAG: hypothetical protein ACPGUH_06625 [Winogradskyella sp.]